MSKIRDQAVKNLKSAGWKAAKTGARTADKAASGLFNWMVTDHSRVGFRMPTGLGFFGTIWYFLMQLLVVVVGSVLTGILAFVLIAYGIPLLITGHF